MEDKKTNQILVQVVLDRSGSMQTSRAGTISGYNEYIAGLRADKDSDYRVTLIQFDAPVAVPELTVTYEDRALADVPVLTENEYQPRGNTPLYDAIGECVRRTEAKGRGVICLIMTDGEENASTEFTKDSVKALIKSKEAEGWTFSFLGANIDSYAVGGSTGFRGSSISNYTVGNEVNTFRALSNATVLRAASYRTEGLTCSVGKDFLSASHRAEMTGHPPIAITTTTTTTALGGRPAAPPNFPAPPKTRAWHVSKP
jgi:hypothetical protein